MFLSPKCYDLLKFKSPQQSAKKANYVIVSKLPFTYTAAINVDGPIIARSKHVGDRLVVVL